MKKLNKENFQLKKEIKALQSKLNDYTQMHDAMESHCVALVKLTDEMSKAFPQSSQTTGDQKMSPGKTHVSKSLWKRKESPRREGSYSPSISSALE